MSACTPQSGKARTFRCFCADIFTKMFRVKRFGPIEDQRKNTFAERVE